MSKRTASKNGNWYAREIRVSHPLFRPHSCFSLDVGEVTLRGMRRRRCSPRSLCSQRKHVPCPACTFLCSICLLCFPIHTLPMSFGLPTLLKHEKILDQNFSALLEESTASGRRLPPPHRPKLLIYDNANLYSHEKSNQTCTSCKRFAASAAASFNA